MVLLLGETFGTSLVAVMVTEKEGKRKPVTRKCIPDRVSDLPFNFPNLESYLSFKFAPAPTPGHVLATVYGAVQCNANLEHISSSSEEWK